MGSLQGRTTRQSPDVGRMRWRRAVTALVAWHGAITYARSRRYGCMVGIVPLFGFMGGPEMIVILAVFVLLFGANKLPQLARSSGQALGEFKKGRMDIEDEIREAATSEPTHRTDEEQTETA